MTTVDDDDDDDADDGSNNVSWRRVLARIIVEL